MTSIQGVARQLPVDRHGRVRMPADQRAEILAEFSVSGMTGVAFAAHVGVKYPTFAGWIRRAGMADGSRPAVRRGRPTVKRIRFAEAVSVAPDPATALELELPGGARLHVTDRSQLPLAVELLRSLSPC